jgi:hypothetical protein
MHPVILIIILLCTGLFAFLLRDEKKFSLDK